jgi:hypothetical protein
MVRIVLGVSKSGPVAIGPHQHDCNTTAKGCSAQKSVAMLEMKEAANRGGLSRVI